MVETTLKIAVCGGGISGFTFAVAASKFPHLSVDIYEKANEFAFVGAGIGIWSRNWKILKQLGITDGLLNASTIKPSDELVHSFNFRKGDEESGIEFFELFGRGPFFTLHRKDLQGALLAHIPPSYRIHYSKRLKDYFRRPNGQIEVHFQDGTTTICDLLVGADGLKSSVRGILLRRWAEQCTLKGEKEKAEDLLDMVSPKWSGTVAYRGLVPMAKVKQQVETEKIKIPALPTQYLGKNAHAILFPIMGGTMMNVVAFRTRPELENTTYDGPWVTAVKNEDVLLGFSKFERGLKLWLENIENPSCWAIHVVKPLPSFVHDGVALIGDAAHAMTPHQGAGAGQGIEDAVFLATILGHCLTGTQNLPRALEIYDICRRPFGQEIAHRSYINGQYYTFNHADCQYDAGSEEERQKALKKVGEGLYQNYSRMWVGSFDDLMQEGLRRLREHEGTQI